MSLDLWIYGLKISQQADPCALSTSTKKKKNDAYKKQGQGNQLGKAELGPREELGYQNQRDELAKTTPLYYLIAQQVQFNVLALNKYWQGYTRRYMQRLFSVKWS